MRDAAPLARRTSYNSNATTLDAQFLTKILLGFLVGQICVYSSGQLVHYWRHSVPFQAPLHLSAARATIRTRVRTAIPVGPFAR